MALREFNNKLGLPSFSIARRLDRSLDISISIWCNLCFTSKTSCIHKDIEQSKTLSPNHSNLSDIPEGPQSKPSQICILQLATVFLFIVQWPKFSRKRTYWSQVWSCNLGILGQVWFLEVLWIFSALKIHIPLTHHRNWISTKASLNFTKVSLSFDVTHDMRFTLCTHNMLQLSTSKFPCDSPVLFTIWHTKYWWSRVKYLFILLHKTNTTHINNLASFICVITWLAQSIPNTTPWPIIMVGMGHHTCGLCRKACCSGRNMSGMCIFWKGRDCSMWLAYEQAETRILVST